MERGGEDLLSLKRRVEMKLGLEEGKTARFAAFLSNSELAMLDKTVEECL
jgi:hypothetical protein